MTTCYVTGALWRVLHVLILLDLRAPYGWCYWYSYFADEDIEAKECFLHKLTKRINMNLIWPVSTPPDWVPYPPPLTAETCPAPSPLPPYPLLVALTLGYLSLPALAPTLTLVPPFTLCFPLHATCSRKPSWYFVTHSPCYIFSSFIYTCSLRTLLGVNSFCNYEFIFHLSCETESPRCPHICIIYPHNI